jgi:hypothetical protein
MKSWCQKNISKRFKSSLIALFLFALKIEAENFTSSNLSFHKFSFEFITESFLKELKN